MTDRYTKNEPEIKNNTRIPHMLSKNDLETQDSRNTDPPDLQQNDKDTSIPTSSRKGVIHQLLLTCAVFLITASGGMPIGYSAVVLPQLYNSTEEISLDMESGSWFASVHNLATPIGALAVGSIMDSYGRKPALIITIVPFVAGWTVIATAPSYILLLVGRVLTGLAVGCFGPACQVMIGECAEPKLRGILVSASFAAYSVGIMVTYSFGLFLTWRNSAWASIITPVIATSALCLVPESPTWLIRNNQLKTAEAAMSWYRCNDRLVKIEIDELVARFEADKNEIQFKENILATCKRRSVLKPLVLINVFNILLTTSGTYLVVTYAVDIIADLGVSIDNMLAAVLTAAVRVVCCCIFCVLLFYINRRPLISGSGIGSGISTLVMAIFAFWRRNMEASSLDLYVSSVCILIYIGTNTGLMILPGIMISELIPAKVRGRVAGYIWTFFHLLSFAIIKMFPLLNDNFKIYGLFLMFSLSSFAIVVFMFYMLPETNNKTLGEIEDYFNGSNWFWTTTKRNTDET